MSPDAEGGDVMMEKTEKARYLIITNPAVGIDAAEAMRDKVTISRKDRVGVN